MSTRRVGLAAGVARKIAQFAERVWRALTTLTRRLSQVMRMTWDGVQERHQARMGSDPTYAAALASGTTAVLSVLSASPAISAAVTVLIHQWLRLGRTPHTGARDRTRYPDWDDEPDDYWDRPRNR